MLAKLLISPAFFFILSNTGSDTPINWNPEDTHIPYSIADMRTPEFKISIRTCFSKKIPSSARHRAQYSLGTIIPVAKKDKLQFNFGASFISQTDLEEHLDISGWDGVIITDCGYKISDRFAVKFSSKHISGHLGDEYMEKTKRERISHSRDENALSVWISPREYTSVIIESAFDYNYDHDKKYNYKGSPWRHQFALFAIKDTKMEWTPYWAVDIQAHQEDKWQPSYSVQLGYSFSNKNSRRLRVGAEYYRGKVNLMEFSGQREEFVSIGMWINF